MVSTIRCAVPVLLAGMLCVAAAQAGGEPKTVDVRIIDYRFEPARLEIEVGTTVRWINAERRTSHSILLHGAHGIESERIFPEEHWEHRFDAAGVYTYGCGPHPEMHGEVVVVE
jgi:plastocyanin